MKGQSVLFTGLVGGVNPHSFFFFCFVYPDELSVRVFPGRNTDRTANPELKAVPPCFSEKSDGFEYA